MLWWFLRSWQVSPLDLEKHCPGLNGLDMTRMRSLNPRLFKEDPQDQASHRWNSCLQLFTTCYLPGPVFHQRMFLPFIHINAGIFKTALN